MSLLPTERTSVPGGLSPSLALVAVYRSDGRQRKQTAATLMEARAIKLAHHEAARAAARSDAVCL
jgi:hypothetical protein